MAPALVWLRRNLRLHDNATLTAAAECGNPVILVYVLDELDEGGASRWWLHHSLTNLDKDLRNRGGSLLLLSGPPEIELARAAEQCGAERLFFSRRYEPQARCQEESISATLNAQIEIHAEDDNYLNHPVRPMTKSGTPFRVFTPYWRAASALPQPPRPLPVPDDIRFAEHDLESLRLEDLDLLPSEPDWAQGLRDSWTPGEQGALRRLDELESAARYYAEQRDRPDLDTTSRLSPHLHFGEVSARQVWHALQHQAAHANSSTGAEALCRQLYWRDFSAYLLFHFPTLPKKPLRKEFGYFPWSDDSESLRAWQKGMTGYPIVDAGMRQLWATGWMHNRVRMIVASFLVKDLLIPWQQGADWFLDTLVDADLANNSAGWQWVAGCGTDAAPYFRIFNPVLQGKKFDPAGDYVRRWVPELAAMPDEHIHAPWGASIETQISCGVVIGDDYPRPIVDHGKARQNALAAYQMTRSAMSADSAD
ncbi:MAG: DNA photolyase family protein [Gammaproteobacteria bacterium]|nr:DNA photolyase family protein [Gammaproteobacteria bacterium]MDH3553886.1 DNA photolyase family protein [Gammaproteobacteria bacterium]